MNLNAKKKTFPNIYLLLMSEALSSIGIGCSVVQLQLSNFEVHDIADKNLKLLMSMFSIGDKLVGKMMKPNKTMMKKLKKMMKKMKKNANRSH